MTEMEKTLVDSMVLGSLQAHNMLFYLKDKEMDDATEKLLMDSIRDMLNNLLSGAAELSKARKDVSVVAIVETRHKPDR